MALTIRLQRHGKIHRPFYHIVAAHKAKSRNGRFVEKLGYYDPNHEPSQLVFKEDRIKYWYSKGAEVSPTVANLMKKNKVELTRENTGAAKK